MTNKYKKKHSNDIKCYLNHEVKQCCCNCIRHRKIYFRNTFKEIDGYEWACVLPFSEEEDLGVHIPWPKHSIGCECYVPIKKK